MAVSTGIPTTWRMPLTWIKVDPSQAGTFTQRYPALLVGQKLAAGTATADQPVAVQSVSVAKTLFGQGSMLARMVEKFLGANPSQELYAGPVVEPAGGTAATGTITITGTATASGILPLYIAGQVVNVAVSAGDVQNTIATNVNAAINAATDLPVTSTVATNVVTATCRWKGLTGNDITLQAAYGGALAGEAVPAGVTVAFSGSGKLSGGVGAPDFTALIAALGDEPYEYVAMPFTDSTSLGIWDTEYAFSDVGRWGWIRQDYGMLFSAYRDTYANLYTWGPTGNSGVTSVLAVAPTVPNPVWEIAAVYTAVASFYLTDDPARPLQTLELTGILPAPKNGRFSLTNVNNLNQVGFAVTQVSGNGIPMIMRESTRWQKNVYGQPDNAYELVTTLATLAYIFRQMRNRMMQKFPRHKLANDGTKFGTGQAIATPKTIKAEIVALYSELEFDGKVENMAAFKKYLIVERDSQDPNRVNVLLPPDIVNQLRVMAVLASFRLQFPASA